MDRRAEYVHVSGIMSDSGVTISDSVIVVYSLKEKIFKKNYSAKQNKPQLRWCIEVQEKME